MMKKYIFAAGLCGTLLLTQTAFAVTNDYTHYWMLDEGTGRSANDVVGGQNGALTGSSTDFGWTSGKVNVALAMDGGAGEGVALPDGMLSGSQGTISAWIKLSDLTDRNIIFSGKSKNDNNIYAALMVDHEGRPQLQSRDTANATDRRAQGTQILNKNEWYNIVLTANAQSYHMFLNGQEVSVAGENSGRWFPDITNQTLMYRIGTLDSSPLSGSMNGIIDDVKIYNRPLSAEEVSALYEEGNAGRPSTPIGFEPTLSFTVDTNHVVPGGKATLSWSGTNLVSCVASGLWSDPVETSGSRVVTISNGDATFILTCSNTYGSVSSTVHVAASDAPVSATSTTTGLSVTPVETGAGNSASIGETNTPQTGNTGATLSSDARKAAIQELIKQILVLIAELQKQLATMKSAAGVTN